MNKTFIISSYACSNIGLVRTSNEDFFAQLQNENFFIIADGMGGHNAGEVAAKEAVEFICSEIQSVHNSLRSIDEKKRIIKHLNKLINTVNQRIITMSNSNESLKGMGTTLCSSYFKNNYLIYSHVGDSRLYRFRKNKLEQLTADHSLENAAKISPSKKILLNSPRSKKYLTQAIGIHKKITPEIGIESVFHDDIYFLCSDGLTDFVSNDEIKKVLLENDSIDEMTESLIEQAIHRGGKDNITIIMMKVNEDLPG